MAINVELLPKRVDPLARKKSRLCGLVIGLKKSLDSYLML